MANLYKLEVFLNEVYEEINFLLNSASVFLSNHLADKFNLSLSAGAIKLILFLFFLSLISYSLNISLFKINLILKKATMFLKEHKLNLNKKLNSIKASKKSLDLEKVE